MVTSNALGHFMYSRSKDKRLDQVAINWALGNAMRTINNAYRGPKGKRASTKLCPATNLVPLRDGELTPLRPNFELADKSPDHYEGYFHTDHLIPSVFFEPHQRKTPPPRYLDLTFRYIYDPNADPEEHQELMTGVGATWYDVRRNTDRLPSFVNPEKTPGLTVVARARLARWLEQRLRSRIA